MATGFIHTATLGAREGAVRFHQMWLAARQAGTALENGAYSPASVIGSAGKFVHPSGEAGSPLATILYGLRLNPARYRDVLLDAAQGLPTIEGEIAQVERRDDNHVAALVLRDGSRLEADLFVDCSGPSSAIIGAMGGEFDDWSASLPARHISADWRPARTSSPSAE